MTLGELLHNGCRGCYELHDYKGNELDTLNGVYNDCRVLQIRAIGKDKFSFTINPDIHETERKTNYERG